MTSPLCKHSLWFFFSQANVHERNNIIVLSVNPPTNTDGGGASHFTPPAENSIHLHSSHLLNEAIRDYPHIFSKGWQERHFKDVHLDKPLY
jgi:hypothetical protein